MTDPVSTAASARRPDRLRNGGNRAEVLVHFRASRVPITWAYVFIEVSTGDLPYLVHLTVHTIASCIKLNDNISLLQDKAEGTSTSMRDADGLFAWAEMVHRAPQSGGLILNSVTVHRSQPHHDVSQFQDELAW
ncbi:hypothetical protein [Paenibacillus jiagnxiensis]|uniref:hypothetical protein n=1 Tax=Paenibacillus jiagnxiensis TaxID=3228926 RepID=UPI0033ADCB9F